jgi:hypothetical protein
MMLATSPQRQLRARLTIAIEAMIDLLDCMDGDADAEEADGDTEHDGREPVNSDLYMGGVA